MPAPVADASKSDRLHHASDQPGVPTLGAMSSLAFVQLASQNLGLLNAPQRQRVDDFLRRLKDEPTGLDVKTVPTHDGRLFVARAPGTATLRVVFQRTDDALVVHNIFAAKSVLDARVKTLRTRSYSKRRDLERRGTTQVAANVPTMHS